MRMRRKKNLIPRLNAVKELFAAAPEELRAAAGDKRLWAELGCGMGSFAARTARANPGIFYAAFERVPEAIVVAAEKSAGIPNIRFICRDARELDQWLPSGAAERLFILFCDPWHKKKQSKRRLTHRDFLKIYAEILSKDGELVFKTDNTPLFEFTLEELKASGWNILTAADDWHGDPSRDKDEPVSEYESRFIEKGQAIGRITARPNSK
ncbi:MAG: tRNA (guanosine(46)-N7)-methyltransferase TrmB [Oscillospiraceae bacterium]|nr:tRNA (guanosine(46)-N7)-methyltransferase TrmB [Oscillospiraceae bacterium]